VYLLTPRYHDSVLLPRFAQQVKEFIKSRCGNDGYEDFIHYCDQDSQFNIMTEGWQEWVEKPIMFWKSYRSVAPKLAELAIQLQHITANSVASERAFSTMNFLQNKLRSRMTIETMDMLSFVYMNSRSLRKAANRTRGQQEELSANQSEALMDELLNMEDDLVQFEVDEN